MPFQPRQTYSEVLLLKTIVSLRNAAKTKQNKTKQNKTLLLQIILIILDNKMTTINVDQHKLTIW
jgi:hypothetical protein